MGEPLSLGQYNLFEPEELCSQSVSDEGAREGLETLNIKLFWLKQEVLMRTK
jgi:hypothetical protein